MKKLLLILICLILTGGLLFSQDLSPVRRDFVKMLEGLGGELITDVQQNELEGIGLHIGEMGEKNFFFAMSLGALFTDGIFKFVSEDNVEYFEMLNVSGLIDDLVLGAVPEYEDLYTKTKTFFLYPNARISAGFKLFDVETIIMFSILPQGLIDAVSGLVPALTGIELNNMNIGLRVRYPLIKDEGAFPAISIGAGYTYGAFHVAYTLPEFTQEFSGSELSLAGQISLDTLVYTAGIDFTVSKKFLFFAPYFKVSSYYQWSSYTGEIKDYSVQVINVTDSENPLSVLSVNDLSVILGSGFELIFGGFSLVPGATYNLSSGSLAAIFAIRAQF